MGRRFVLPLTPSPTSVATGALLAVAVLTAALPVVGRPKVRYREGWAERPWARYAAMSAQRCRAELERRGVRATPVDAAPGVIAPVRLPEGAGGVLYRTEGPAHVRARSPAEVLDCRLALALTDLSGILRARGVVEAVMLSAWRPKRGPGPRAGGAAGSTELRHPGGLAVDILRFGKGPPGEGAPRVWLDVERDFGGTLGAPVCGAGAPPAATPAGRELRAIVCEAASQHLFTSILTPSYDRAHKNHVHLELRPGVQWELLR